MSRFISKTIHRIFFLFLFVQTSFAQTVCEVVIPAETEVIRRSPFIEKIAKDKSYWICNDAIVTFRAGGGIFYVESGSTLTLSYGNYTVYLKNGATLKISTKSTCQVYYERNAKIVESAMTSYKDYHVCDYIVYDYTAAPDNICPKLDRPVIEYRPEIEPDSIPIITEHETTITVPDNPNSAFENSHIIPNRASVIKPGIGQSKDNSNNKVYWLCREADMIFTGNGNIFYVEPDAKLRILQGNGNIIYLKSGANLAMVQGSENQIYYAEGANLIQNGAKRSQFTKLLEMEFDYKEVSLKGCE